MEFSLSPKSAGPRLLAVFLFALSSERVNAVGSSVPEQDFANEVGPSPLRSAKQASTHSWAAVSAEGGFGFGLFQDIQVPEGERGDERGDGTSLGEENQTHAGIPIHLAASATHRLGQNLNWELFRLSFMQIRAATGPAATQGSSYVRTEIASGLKYGFLSTGTWNFDVSGTLGVRRSSFVNVSNAHYLMSYLVGASLGAHTEGFAFQSYVRMAPVSRFGYSEATFFGGHDLDGSTASLSEIGSRVGFRLRPEVWFDIDLAKETANVRLADVNAYNGLGLKVFALGNESRSYVLETSVLRLGIRKEF